MLRIAAFYLLALTLSLPAAAEKTLRFAMWGLPAEGGNPFAALQLPAILTIPAVYDGLTHIQYDGTVTPQLALAWRRENDLTWIFDLRRDARFSNGEPLDASAIAAAFDYLRTDEGKLSAVGREVEAIVRAEARDPYTLALTTKSPKALLPREVATVRIPAPEWWRKVGPAGAARAAVGSGPFTVTEWTDNRIVFAANRASWRAPRIDRVTMTTLPDQNSRMQALLSGAVDVATSIGPDDRGAIEAAGGRFVASLWAGVTTIFFVATTPGPVADVRVRQALNYAVDKDRIVATLMGGATVVASQPAAPGTFGHNPDLSPYPYDPARARALLAAAGYPAGFEMTIEVPAGIGVNADAWHVQVASDLAEVGVRVTLRSISMISLTQKIYSGKWEGQAFTAAFNTLPSLDALRAFRQHSCLWPHPWYCNPADTPLIEAAQREGDPDRLEGMVQELLRRYHDDPPGIYMFQLPGFTALGPRVKNFVTDYGIYNFHDVELTAKD